MTDWSEYKYSTPTIVEPDPELPHGSYSTYVNHRCRCEPCRAANVVENRRQRAKRHAKLLVGEVNPPHGVYTTYTNYGCRCSRCRTANNHYRNRARARARDRARR